MEYKVIERSADKSKQNVIYQGDCLKTAVSSFLNYGREIRAATKEGAAKIHEAYLNDWKIPKEKD